MKYFSTLLFILLLAIGPKIFCQQTAIDKVAFFKDTGVLHAALVTDLNKLLRQKMEEGKIFPAKFMLQNSGKPDMEANINLQVRGHFRRENCYLPPLKVVFNKDPAAPTASLKSLKLVTACKTSDDYNQYILKEYLIYKMYNLFTDKSLRVRLFNLEYRDSIRPKKNIQVNAFLLEDIKDAAKRNKCKELDSVKLHPENADRKLMTQISLFEYMIGNTDWAVSVQHNIKLIISTSDKVEKPYAVPYDFDYSGLVDAPYAIPDPMLNTQSVTERVYRGFPRTMEELNEALIIFNRLKENIYALINDCSLLSARNKKYMSNYLDQFFRLIGDPGQVKSVFITNARTE